MQTQSKYRECIEATITDKRDRPVAINRRDVIVLFRILLVNRVVVIDEF